MRIFVSYHTGDFDLVNQVVSSLAKIKTDADLYFAPKSNVGGVYWVPRLEAGECTVTP